MLSTHTDLDYRKKQQELFIISSASSILPIFQKGERWTSGPFNFRLEFATRFRKII